MLHHPDYSNLRINPSDLLRPGQRHRPRSGAAGETCGCCPACGELVVVAATDDGVGSPCPSCGAAIDRLVPLGARP